jgi:outer membrane protein assembly factor BamB
MRRVALALALTALIAACSKDKDVDRPKELVPLTHPALRVTRAWSANVGGTKKPLRLGLALSVQQDVAYAAGEKGEVAAFNVTTGHLLWQKRTKLQLGAGPSMGGELLVVGSVDGDVVALEANNGAPRWRVNVGGELLAPAAVTEKVVVVRAVDGKLHGLSPVDGHELWQLQQPVPHLSLRGTSRPQISGDLAICGFDNGKVMAANLIDGTSAWETMISPAQGKTDIERLNDVDAAPRIAGNDVYVAQFQGKIAMLALDSGQIWWSHDMSSYRGLNLDLDDEALYVSTSDGEVVALRRRTGEELWRQKALGHRGLSAPVVSADAVIVGDFQGYVHWLNKSTGAIIARERTGKARISNPPVVSGNLLLVINDRGVISAFRTTPIAVASARSPGASAPSAAPPSTTPPSAPAASDKPSGD